MCAEHLATFGESPVDSTYAISVARHERSKDYLGARISALSLVDYGVSLVRQHAIILALWRRTLKHHLEAFLY